MPLKEIDRRFTKSELVLMAWRSHEASHQMSIRIKNADGKNSAGPKKVEEMTSEEAMRSFQKMGIMFPMAVG